MANLRRAPKRMKFEGRTGWCLERQTVDLDASFTEGLDDFMADNNSAVLANMDLNEISLDTSFFNLAGAEYQSSPRLESALRFREFHSNECETITPTTIFFF